MILLLKPYGDYNMNEREEEDQSTNFILFYHFIQHQKNIKKAITNYKMTKYIQFGNE